MTNALFTRYCEEAERLNRDRMDITWDVTYGRRWIFLKLRSYQGYSELVGRVASTVVLRYYFRERELRARVVPTPVGPQRMTWEHEHDGSLLEAFDRHLRIPVLPNHPELLY